MNESMIQELLLGVASEYRKCIEKNNSLHNSYYEKFDSYINHIKESQIDEIAEEDNLFQHIKDLIASEKFMNMIGNNQYCDKLKRIFAEKYIVGQSKVGLTKLEQNIEELCQQYIQHYNEFVDNATKQMENDEQKEMIELNRNCICTYRFFNKISNANLC